MTTTFAITEAILSINQAESRFHLRREDDPQFFPEWFADLPTLSPAETETMDRLRRIYAYHRADGPLAEGTVNLLLVSPLLYAAGFCEPPFRIRAEVPVEIAVADRDEILRGRIDALVLQNRFWLVFLEAKRSTFSYLDAVPQTLAYMMATPESDRPVYGLVTNGDNFLFIKLVRQSQSTRYALSSDFSSYVPPQNDLYDVLRIMKRIGGQIRVPES